MADARGHRAAKLMDISWLGHACFRLRGKDATLLTDPPAPSSGYSLARVSADIVTISHHHPGHDYLKGVHGDPKVIDGPGEYEVKQVLITGVHTFHDRERGARLGRNTAYLMTIDDVHICHLGDLGDTLDAAATEVLSGADVVLVPVGGGNALDAVRAAEVIAQIEPRLIIPMHYATAAYKPSPGSAPLDPVDRFCAEMGVEVTEPVAKLTVTTSSLPAEPQVVLLNFRG